MRGTIEIDKQSGSVENSTLPEDVPQKDLVKMSDAIIAILQDIAVYMRETGAQNMQNV
jgi:hypothetical protein